jgi:hypothetical protein
LLQKVPNLDETLTPIVKGFSQEEEVALNALMHAPPVLDLSINEIVLMLGCFESSTTFNSLFDRSYTFFLALYIDKFIILFILKNTTYIYIKIFINNKPKSGRVYTMDLICSSKELLELK